MIRAALVVALVAPSIAAAQRNACGLWSSGATIVATTGDTIRRSTDGGATWSDTPLHSAKYFPVCAITGSGANLVAAGSMGQIFHSGDSGVTWTAVMAGSADDALHDVWASGSTFLAVGDFHTILQSTDGGARWRRISLPAMGRDSMFAIVGIAGSGDTVVAVSTTNILRSTDVGWHWTRVWQPDGFVFHEVWMDGATAVAIGSWGTIVRSTDGGASWKVVRRTPRPRPVMERGALVYPGASESLDAVWGRGTTWFIVGADGLVLRSTDGGAHWDTVASGTTEDLVAVWGSGDGVIAVGLKGAIVRLRP